MVHFFSLHRAGNPRPEADEADIDAIGASGLDQQRACDVGELAAEPEFFFALADDLADQRRRPALKIVAVVGEVVAVVDEALDRFLVGHQLGDHLMRLMVPHVRPGSRRDRPSDSRLFPSSRMRI